MRIVNLKAFLFICLLSPLFCLGQNGTFENGTYVTMQKDTVQSKIFYADLDTHQYNNSFSYVPTPDADISYRGARSYKVKDREYHNYSYLKAAPKGFMLLLQEGTVHLYFHIKAGWNRAPGFESSYEYSERYYIVKGQDFVRVPYGKKKFRRELSALFADNSSLVEAINNKELDYEQIEEIVRRYNASNE